jgi:thiol:disulfide interchange protein DsbD
MRRQNPFINGVIWVLFLTLSLAASASAGVKTQIRLLLSAESARPGDTIWAGVQLDMPAGWHTYWTNGGDAGQATTLQWTLPAGVKAGEMNWPLPAKQVETAGDTSLVTYVYTNRVIFPVRLTVDKTVAPGPLQITVTAKWMECADICVFGGGEATATLNIGDSIKPSAAASTIDEWRNKVPQPDTASAATAYWETLPLKDNSRSLVIAWRTNGSPVDFLPYASTNFDIDGKTAILVADFVQPATAIRKIVKKNGDDWPNEIDGVLVGKIGTPEAFGIEEHLKIQASAPAGAAPPSTTTKPAGALMPMLFLAFLGGLILNIMPCVLPVIALKVLGFVNQSKEEPRRVRRLGGVYGLGVLTSFLVLAGLAIGAQRAGGVANWGDAFRNSQFQIIITTLMMLIALNLFGVFEITLSGKALGAASELSGRSGFSGAFMNGVLATILATPCTAPFLGVALAFAFSQPPIVIIAVFLAAGAGLAFPFVAICWNPTLLKLLPKPGAWMEKFKNAMGFPMLATAVWLMWVSSSREDDELWLGLFLVVLALAAWIWGTFVQRGTRGRAVAIVICLLVVGTDYGAILEGQLQWRSPPESKSAGIDWKTWSADAVEEARKAGHPVLVDFTAKSCLTCKLNLASSIDIDRTRAELKKINAVALKADYTLEDPVIGRELHKFGTSGVPLVLVYSPDVSKDPQVLPTFLTPTIVNEALDKAAK